MKNKHLKNIGHNTISFGKKDLISLSTSTFNINGFPNLDDLRVFEILCNHYIHNVDETLLEYIKMKPTNILKDDNEYLSTLRNIIKDSTDEDFKIWSKMIISLNQYKKLQIKYFDLMRLYIESRPRKEVLFKNFIINKFSSYFYHLSYSDMISGNTNSMHIFLKNLYIEYEMCNFAELDKTEKETNYIEWLKIIGNYE